MAGIADFRSEFPAAERAVFLNNAAVCPISMRVKKRMDEWTEHYLHLGSSTLGDDAPSVAKTRKLSAGMLGCKETEVAFVMGTSGGLALFASSLDWRTADNVVTASNEFPSNIYPWMNLKRKGVHIRMVDPTPEGRVRIEDLMEAVDSRTRVVTISWVGFNTGFRIDLERLGAECARRGVHLVVDAIQGLGAFEMKASEWGVSAAAADAHKWLLGPEGIAVLYVNENLIDSLNPALVGWKSIRNASNFMQYDFALADDSKRFEPGSLNTPGIFGFGGALELFGEAGMENVSARIKMLTDRMIKGLESKGLGVRVPRGKNEWSGVVSFDAPGGDGPAFAKVLRDKGIVLTGRVDFLRASPHFYNNTEDIDRLLAEL